MSSATPVMTWSAFSAHQFLITSVFPTGSSSPKYRSAVDCEITTEKDYMKKLAAKVFSIKGKMIKIAYPQELFEKGNAPNILSSIAGNIFGMKAVKNLRLEDIKIPKEILNSFSRPKYWIKIIIKIIKITDKPLLGTIVKPKLGLKTIDHASVSYDSWIGVCDICKDD